MMQNNIAHIERQVAKALDLSLSAYAVAELPQATEERSSVNVGLASADGKTGAAVGYSNNFGANHEYTIKINMSHAGHQNAGGAGFGYQW
ncbi:MAG: YadA C-terminal domain-containing protein [Porticoccus sp.]|nr:YadA C-terminal domain-containing protein [Porticoccus sp.]